MMLDDGKNQVGTLLKLSSPKIKGKYSIIEGGWRGLFRDNKNGKIHILCLIRGGCSERGVADPVDLYS